MPKTSYTNMRRKSSEPTLPMAGMERMNVLKRALKPRADWTNLNMRPILKMRKMVAPEPASTPNRPGRDPKTMTKSNRFQLSSK
mmetsp:Transcript_26464/g.32087  ORF Transcript_26464/g.32087 Transcript_26464/m.32087 type:complete len:84 (-) Transcript_26464:154-405(-)